MAEDRNIDLLDYLLIILKQKTLLITVFIVTLIVSYLLIYFLIPPQYESKAVIIPSGETSLSSLSGLFKDLKNLPLGLGGGTPTSETDLYTTIIYSRSFLEDMINKFNLMKDYNEDSKEKTIKILKKHINAEENDQSAYEITVDASSPKIAADMVNYLLESLNRTVINLNISKSRNNLEFITKRYKEINASLAAAEDSLQKYQEKSGMFEAEEQLKLIMGAYSELDANLLEKKFEFSFLKETLPQDSPLLNEMKTKWDLYKNEIENIKQKGEKNSILLPYKSLPLRAKNYLRHYRDVEIYHSILKIVVPLLEQAKFEEQKNMPILQIIDHGSIPEKKFYPPRVLFSLISTLIVCILFILYLVLRDIYSNSTNPKLKKVKEQLRFKKHN